MITCMYKFLTTVTKGIVDSIHKVVNRLSFGVIQGHKVS